MSVRKPKTSRQAQTITVQGGEEVYTRYSKREYETRREIFDQDAPTHLAGFYYDEWVEMGAQGGRPKKWANEAQGKQAQRAQAKLAQGKTLTYEERKLLGLIKPRPGARKYHPNRNASPKERKRAERARKKALGL